MISSDEFCDNCGAANPAQAVVCAFCNQPMQSNTISPASLTGKSSTGLLPTHQLLRQRYRIVDKVGQGGMGAVYKALDIQLGNQNRAVKEMSQNSLQTPEEVREATTAFRQEAIILASLNHTNLPHIYDHFEEGGRWYLVMDFIDGENLDDHLQKMSGRLLPIEKVLDIGIQLCTVLDHLHTRNPQIIYRDLKPSNIMLTPDGHIYLIDFGIARFFKPGQSKDTAALGSFGYAAPELYGNKEQTTVKADIYSLGATLHYLLSGDDPTNSPFQFAPLQSGSHSAIFDLDKLVRQMLDMKKENRPASMSEIKDVLQQISNQFSGSATANIATTSSVTLILTPAQVNPAPPTQKMQPQTQTHPTQTVHCIYQGHTQPVGAIAWSPDGKRIVSASNDKTIQIWDATSGQLVLTYSKHNSFMRTVDWSPDGRSIISGGSDNLIHVWDSQTGLTSYTLAAHQAWIRTVIWSPDGKRFASSGDDKTVKIWDVTSGKLILTYFGHTDSVFAVTWSPDGRSIASSSDDKTVHVWESTTGKLITTFTGHTKYIRAITWSSDGKYLVSGAWDNTLYVWDPLSAKHHITYQSHTKLINTVAWLPGSTFIASAGKDKTIQVWDATTGKTIFVYQKHTESVNALAWSPDRSRIASASDDRTVQVWQAN